MKTVTLLVITDGRAVCLKETLISAGEKLIGRIDHQLMIDDSADGRYAAWLDSTFPNFQIIHHPERRGFCGAIQSAWANLPHTTNYIVHLEDDFTLNEPWYLGDVIDVLEANPHLAQMALRRQPVGHEVRFKGGFVEEFWDSYTDREWNGHHWFEHQRFFTTNVSIYPRRITDLGWPSAPHCEGHFGLDRLFPAGFRCAFWGRKADPPKIQHIGDSRVGTGY